jgi:hypothetical protein
MSAALALGLLPRRGGGGVYGNAADRGSKAGGVTADANIGWVLRREN